MIPMDETAQNKLKQLSQDDYRFRPDDSGGLCSRLNDKWTVVVLWRVASSAGHRARFSTLKNEVDGISQRMLTLTLRNLERDGLVLRHFFAEVPPRVEYELTTMGAGLLAALVPINRWMQDNMPEVNRCRLDYDYSFPP